MAAAISRGTAYDVIVVGVGSMGSAACHHLARRGAKVLGIEKFDIPHGYGSSTGFSRIIRCGYHQHSDYVPLVRRSFSLWKELEAGSGQRIMHVTGALYLGPVDGPKVGGAMASARKHGVPVELLARDELSRRYPQFRLREDFVGLFEPEAGFVIPELAVATHALEAMRSGAEIHGRESVHRWSADESGVTVATDRGTYQGGALLFCGGAWTDRLVRDLGVPLRVTRQVLGWFWPQVPSRFEPARFPVWNIDHLDGTVYYGIPMMPDNPGFKVAHHFPGIPSDPETVDRSARPEDEEDLRGTLRRYLPEAEGPLLSLRTCLYTYSPDQQFIIDRHPTQRRVHLACGFSGHGFKFAAVVGEILADLALTGRTNHSIGFLGLGRFKTARPD